MKNTVGGSSLWVKVYRIAWRNLVILAVGTVLLTIITTHLVGRWSHKAVETMAWVVANQVIVIDPGHGGIDPGAVGPAGTLEKDLTLAIARNLATRFEQAGARVVLTRYEDQDLSTPGKNLRDRKKEDLDQRLRIVREQQADLYLSIQVNSFGRKWTGAQTFYHYGSKPGAALGKEIQKEIRRQLGNTTRQAKTLDTYILRQLAEFSAAMVEVGFISNPEEEKMLNNPVYQSRLSWAIYAGAVKYLAGEAKSTVPD